MIKLNHNLIFHTAVIPQKFYGCKDFSVFFRQPDNKDIFSLHLITDSKNELINVDWKTHVESKKISIKIDTPKTIKLYKFYWDKNFGVESYHCKTIKSSTEFLDKLIKLI